jgi:hypothetical protein
MNRERLTKEELKKLLGQSGQPFAFNQEGVKASVLSAIAATPQVKNSASGSGYSLKFIFSSSAAVIMLSSLITYADSSIPGDNLYFLDRLQENISLTLPKTSAAKSRLITKIARERMVELSLLPPPNNQNNLTLKAYERSNESLSRALDEAHEFKQKLAEKGREEVVLEINMALDKLGEMARLEEQKLEDMISVSNDEVLNKRLDIQLEAIKKARQKIRGGPENDDFPESLENAEVKGKSIQQRPDHAGPKEKELN